MFKFIEIEEKIPLLIIRLNRPEFQNKLNIEMMEEIIYVFNGAERRVDIKGIVLSSKGDIFCAGGDLGNYKEKKVLELKEFGEKFVSLHLTVIRIDKPVICAIEGGAFGGGLSLVDVCDFSIASKNAKFGFPEIRNNLVPMMALSGIGKRINKKLLNELSLLGRDISADEAKNFGIVNEVVDDGKAEEIAINWALDIAQKDPIAISFYKSLYRQLYEKDFQESLEKALNVFINLLKAKGES